MPDLPAPVWQGHPGDCLGQRVGLGVGDRGGLGASECPEQAGEGARHPGVGRVEGGHDVDVVGHAFEQDPGVLAEVGEDAAGRGALPGLPAVSHAVEVREHGQRAGLLVEECQVARYADVVLDEPEQRIVVGGVVVA